MFAAPASGSPGPASSESALAPGAVEARPATVLAEVIGAPGTPGGECHMKKEKEEADDFWRSLGKEEEYDDLKDGPKEEPQEPGAGIVLVTGGTPTASAVCRFSDFAFQELMKSVKPFGGPKAWIWSNFQASPQKLESYLHWLWITFPEKSDVFYHTTKAFPNMLPCTDVLDLKQLANETPVAVHVSTLAFHVGSSLKPPPGQEKFGKLLGHYLQDGVVTAPEPLFGMFPYKKSQIPISSKPWMGDLEQVSIGYIKGEARTTTLHAFLVWCWKTGVNIKSVHPVLWESVCAIYLHMFEPNSQLAAAMSNMKMSSRGMCGGLITSLRFVS